MKILTILLLVITDYFAYDWRSGPHMGVNNLFYSSVVMMATCYKKRGSLYAWIKRKDCKRKEHPVVAWSESFHLLMRLWSLFIFIFLLLPFFIILISWWGPSDRLARDRAGHGVSDHVRLLSLVSKALTSGGQCHDSRLLSLSLLSRMLLLHVLARACNGLML